MVTLLTPHLCGIYKCMLSAVPDSVISKEKCCPPNNLHSSIHWVGGGKEVKLKLMVSFLGINQTNHYRPSGRVLPVNLISFIQTSWLPSACVKNYLPLKMISTEA